MSFQKYKRKEFAELRPITQEDIEQFEKQKSITAHETKDNRIYVSISQVDLDNGSPKIGDMVARNPKNYLDQWLIAEKYFIDNFVQSI